MGDNGRTAKAIERAVSFHGTWGQPKRAGRWLIGPTFAVLAAEVEVEAQQASPKEQSVLAKLLSTEGQVDARVDKGPHGQLGKKAKCKYRYVHGELSNQPMGELGYPLYDLARKVGAGTFKAHEIGEGKVAVYGYAGEADLELVVVLAARRIQENCVDVGEETETQETKKGPAKGARPGRKSNGMHKRAPLN